MADLIDAVNRLTRYNMIAVSENFPDEFVPTVELSEVLALIDAHRCLPSVEALAAALHDEWDERVGEVSEGGPDVSLREQLEALPHWSDSTKAHRAEVLAAIAYVDPELVQLRAIATAALDWDATPAGLTISYNPAWIEAGNALHDALSKEAGR